MRSNEDLLAWAREWHWPRLVLSEQDKTSIPAGEQNWRAWAANPKRKSKRQAWQRIQRWQKLAEKKVG